MRCHGNSMMGGRGNPIMSICGSISRSQTLHASAVSPTECAGTCAQDVRRQLYSTDDDRTFFDWIQKELRTVERRLEDGRAVLAHLEGALINVSCDDPGAPIGQQLALPLLQERLDARARGYASQRAAAAEEAIIKEEVGHNVLCFAPVAAAATDSHLLLRMVCSITQ